MADLEETLRPFVESGDVPGLAALVARGEYVEVVTLGSQDASGTPMARDSIFRGASITKPVMAALTMTLVEDGRIDLDAPVGDLLPELAEPRVLRSSGARSTTRSRASGRSPRGTCSPGRRATGSARGSRR